MTQEAVAVEEAPSVSADRPETIVLNRVNALRGAEGLTPLRRLAGLDTAASVHCAEMASHQRLAQNSPRTGSPADRVEAQNVPARRIAQNIARSETLEGALELLLASEAHRAQLLAPEFTDIGLSVVSGREGTIYLTQVLASMYAEVLPPPVVADLAPPSERRLQRRVGTANLFAETYVEPFVDSSRTAGRSPSTEVVNPWVN